MGASPKDFGVTYKICKPSLSLLMLCGLATPIILFSFRVFQWISFELVEDLHKVSF